MMDEEHVRPNPDDILETLKSEEDGKGHLKIFFGYAAGVGKTYAMLDDAQEQLRCGFDVLVGYVEPHTRPETIQLLEGLPTLPPKIVDYKNIQLKEFDLDGALERKPDIILVDELAHSNTEGMRNKKRYQDIEELLNAGIDVFTTVNVQHIESLNDVVQGITKVFVRETIPDYIFDNAGKVKLIDIEPDELLLRFEEGKIYRPDRAQTAMNHFFTKENLKLLREIAMRKAADRISHDNQTEKRTLEKMANIKMLVCISPSSSAAKCIRWTARTAEAFHAPWTAIYVENNESAYFSEEQKRNIRNHMELAERLGGEIVTLNGFDIASVVTEYAKLSGITNIVLGKSRNKKGLRNLWEPPLEDRIISLLQNIEVHIIPDSTIVTPYKQNRRILNYNNFYFSWVDTFKTLGLLVGATALSALLKAFKIGDQNIIMMYIMFVLIISRTTSGYVYGVVASILSVLTFNFLFTEPYFTFNAIQAGYPITFVIMLLAALITSTLTVRIKTQARLAVQRERRTEVLYEINKKLLITRGLENIVTLTNDYIIKLFSRSVVFYTQDPEEGHTEVFLQSEEDPNASFMALSSERAVAHWVFVNSKRAGAGTDTLMGAKAFYMPVMSQGNVLGVLGISCSNGKLLNQDNRYFLRMIASQVAMALERQRLSDEQRVIVIEAEKEKMRSNLLRAISHDLRTPLTSILGASSAILDNREVLDPTTLSRLIYDIKEDSQWLIRMVENLLAVTRINEGNMNVTKTPEAVEEIVAESMSRIRMRFKERKIKVTVPDELLLVPMDGTLIEQVIINLVENAIKYSGDNSEIDVIVFKNSTTATFQVSDNGEGIPEQDLPYVFESYVPNGKKSSDSSRGMGIGLSICRSIVKAHHGDMEASNREAGGAVFKFTLPLEGEG